MTDGGAGYEPGAGEEVAVPFRSRSAYAGFRVFGSGHGAVLLAAEVAHSLRTAAEYATQERRITGGLLYGRSWADDEGTYLVIAGFLEAGPGENPDDDILSDGADAFTLSDPDLRLLRQDAARMYPASLEVGWWRTLAALGEFGPRDFSTQAELVPPGGVGLLVYGSGQHWGTAYLGPEGLDPDSAGTLVATDETAAAPPPPSHLHSPVISASPGPSAATAHQARVVAGEPEPELVDLSAGESLQDTPSGATATPIAPAAKTRGKEPLSPAAQSPVTPLVEQARQSRSTGSRRRQGRPAQRTAPRMRMPPRVRRVAEAPPPGEGYGPPSGIPTDVTFVIGLIALAVIAIAIIVGVLVSSLVVGLIIAVVGVLVVVGSVWMSRK
jgi:hypothetical protein